MPNKSAWEKLIDRAPLAVIVIGVVVFIIGAAGGLPTGNPPLQVTDFTWRIGLGLIGLILVLVGLLLIVREEQPSISKNPKVYGVKIESPTNMAQVSETIAIVSGRYSTKPPDGTLRLFTVTTPDDKSFWPQEIVKNFDDAKKKWSARVHLGGNPRYSMFIVVALVGQASQKFWDYYYKVGEKTNWTPIDGPLPKDVGECDRVWVERV